MRHRRREEERAQLLSGRLEREARLDPPPGAAAELAPPLGLVEQAAKRGRERGGVVAWDDEATRGLTVGEDVRYSLDVGRNDRETARHCLEGGDREAFVPRSEGVYVSGGEVLADELTIVQETVEPRDGAGLDGRKPAPQL